jgi:hypothetical protein
VNQHRKLEVAFAEHHRDVSQKVNYPVGLGTKETKLLFTASETLPMTIVIGRDGRTRDIIEGILLPEEFEQKINRCSNKVTNRNCSCHLPPL